MGELSFVPAGRVDPSAFTAGKIIGNFVLPALNGTSWSGTLAEPAGNFDMLYVAVSNLVISRASSNYSAWVYINIGISSNGIPMLKEKSASGMAATGGAMLIKVPSGESFRGISFFPSVGSGPGTYSSPAAAGTSNSISVDSNYINSGAGIKVIGVKF